jgi:hypothetical protein
LTWSSRSDKVAPEPEPAAIEKEPEPAAIATAQGGGVKLFDVEFTFGQGGPTDKSAR